MKVIALFSVLFFSGQSIAACSDFFKLYGLVNLKTNKWTTLKVDNKVREFCKPMPEIPNANLELRFKKDKQLFTIKIYRSLDGFWDHPETNGKFTGGKMPLKDIEINSFIPSWYSESTLTIQEISSRKILTEVKL